MSAMTQKSSFFSCVITQSSSFTQTADWSFCSMRYCCKLHCSVAGMMLCTVPFSVFCAAN